MRHNIYIINTYTIALHSTRALFQHLSVSPCGLETLSDAHTSGGLWPRAEVHDELVVGSGVVFERAVASTQPHTRI